MNPARPEVRPAEVQAAAILGLLFLLWLACRPGPPALPPPRPLRIDLASAPHETLVALPGIGRVLASRLIAARPLEDRAAVRRVLGEARLRRIAPFVTLRGVSLRRAKLAGATAPARVERRGRKR